LRLHYKYEPNEHEEWTCDVPSENERAEIVDIRCTIRKWTGRNCGHAMYHQKMNVQKLWTCDVPSENERAEIVDMRCTIRKWTGRNCGHAMYRQKMNGDQLWTGDVGVLTSTSSYIFPYIRIGSPRLTNSCSSTGSMTTLAWQMASEERKWNNQPNLDMLTLILKMKSGHKQWSSHYIWNLNVFTLNFNVRDPRN